MTKDIYTVRDLSDLMQVSEKAIRRLINGGELKAAKILGKWFVTSENLKLFLDAKTIK